MKKIYLVLVLLQFCFPSGAQKFISIQDKSFNYGAKIGFNAGFPIVNSLTIDGVETENVRLQYKVGYQASIFCRVNIERFFIQPSLGWYRTEGDIRFSIPSQVGLSLGQPDDPALALDQLQIKTSGVGLPVLIGYHLVKEGPYGLSLMAGPKLNYHYKVRYTSNFSNTPREYINDSTPFGVNIVTGLSVSIWRLFLDFTYEFGLNHVESDFKDMSSFSPIEGNIQIDKRTNAMSFSLGVLF